MFDTNGNYWEISGVQLEVGSISTSYAHEDYGTTFIKCQRYFQTIESPGGATTAIAWPGVCDSATAAYAYYRLPVQMRAAPTVTLDGDPSGVDRVYFASTNRLSAYGSAGYLTTDSGYLTLVLTGATAGQVGRWSLGAGSNIRWSAEL